MNNHESYCHSDQERWIFRWKTGVVLLSNFITKSHRGFLSVEVVGLNTTAEISKELFLIIAGLGMPLMVYFLHSSSTAEVIELVRFVCLSVSQPSHDQTN